MNDRANAYANQFEDLSQQFIAMIERCTPAQLQARCAGEQCSVAALAAHIAEGHPIIADWIAVAAAGGPLPKITMAEIDTMNAEQFTRDENRPKEEILAALRTNGAAAAALVRSLDDTELDRSVYFTLLDEEVTADWLIQHILIDELIHHPASIHAACEPLITA